MDRLAVAGGGDQPGITKDRGVPRCGCGGHAEGCRELACGKGWCSDHGDQCCCPGRAQQGLQGLGRRVEFGVSCEGGRGRGIADDHLIGERVEGDPGGQRGGLEDQGPSFEGFHGLDEGVQAQLATVPADGWVDRAQQAVGAAEGGMVSALAAAVETRKEMRRR